MNTKKLNLNRGLMIPIFCAWAIVGSLFSISSSAIAAPFNTTLTFDSQICTQTDVTGSGGDPDATACVGFVNGNDNATMDDWNTIDWTAATNTSNVVPSNFNSTQPLGLFGYTDWLGDGAKAYKCDESAGCSSSDPAGSIDLYYDETTGTIGADLSTLTGLTEYAVMLKQSDLWAAYLFPATAAFTLEYSWTHTQTGPTNDLSHASLIYRTGEVIRPPENDAPTPGTLVLLAGPLLGMAAWRRRRSS